MTNALIDIEKLMSSVRHLQEASLYSTHEEISKETKTFLRDFYLTLSRYRLSLLSTYQRDIRKGN